MSDTAATLQDKDIRPLFLDDSSGRDLTVMDQFDRFVFRGAGISNPRASRGRYVQVFQPDNSMAIERPHYLGVADNPETWGQSPQVVVALPLSDPITHLAPRSVTDIINLHGELSYIPNRALVDKTAYLVSTNFDAILEHVEIQFLSDGALLEDPLRIEHLLGGFEPAVEDIGVLPEYESEDEEQLEVAVELEANFPPKKTRTVIGTVGARFKAPFKTAFSEELADADGG